MHDDPIKKLAELFEEFPGIGPRQALRMVYSLIGKNDFFKKSLVERINSLAEEISRCELCNRRFASRDASNLCGVCKSPKREKSSLMVVAHDTDIDAVEKSSAYRGMYFVLGGLIPLLEKSPEVRINQNGLLNRISVGEKDGLKEIILALNATAEGDNTLEYLLNLLSPLKKNEIKISVLGRGLSTGTELEYSDAGTIKNALQNRHDN